MRVNKILVGMSTGVLMVGVLVTPAIATNKKIESKMRSFSISLIRNIVGTVNDVESSIFLKGSYIDMHCDSVRRVQIMKNYFEDIQSCKITSPENFPKKTTVLLFSGKGENCPKEGNDQCWYSDYVYTTTGEPQLSIGGTRIVKPDGKVEIISFYRT